MKKAITESQLLIPALMVLAEKQGYVTTGELKKELAKRLTLHKEDKVKVSRGRVRFFNTVGNLISHKTIDKYVIKKTTNDGKYLFKLARAGRQYMYSKMSV